MAKRPPILRGIKPGRGEAVAQAALSALIRKDAHRAVCLRLRERRDPRGRKVNFYDPHDAAGTGGQKAFHELKHREKYAIAAIRGGKSIAGSNELLDEMEKRPSTKANPSRWAVMTPTYRDGERILDFTLLRYLAPDVIAHRNRSAYEIRLLDGAIIYLISTEHVDRIDTLPDLDGCWADEVEDMPAIARLKMLGRLANRGGKFWGTTTPQKRRPAGGTVSWLYELLLERGVTVKPGDSGVKDGGDIGIVSWSLAQNPHFPAEEIPLLAAKFGPRLAAQELEAGYVDLEAGGAFNEGMFLIEVPPPEGKFVHLVVTHDPAISLRGGADYSVSHVWGEDNSGLFWCLEERRGHFTFNEQVETLLELAASWAGVSAIGIEDVAYQKALIQEVERELTIRKDHPNPVPVIPVKPDKGRADRLSGQLAKGRCRFAPVVATKDFINEFLSFPNWHYDDRVVAAAYGVDLLRRSTRPVEVKIKHKRRPQCFEKSSDDSRKDSRKGRRRRERPGRELAKML